jgi:hypothetical protein
MTQQHRIQVAESRLVPPSGGSIGFGCETWVTTDQRGEVIAIHPGDEYGLAAGIDYLRELMEERLPLQRIEVALEYRASGDYELVARAYDVVPEHETPEPPAVTPASRALRELADALDAMATGNLPPVAVEVLVKPQTPDAMARRSAVIQLGRALGVQAATGLTQDERVVTYPSVSMAEWRASCALIIASLRGDL